MSGIDHLRAMARLAIRGMRAGDAAASASTTPRRRLAVEKPALWIDPARVRRYLRATGGDAIEAFRGPDALVPPLFCAMWAATAVLELLAAMDPPLPLGAFLHVEEEVMPLRPLRAGERVRFRLELDRVERTPRGARLTLVARTWNAAGVLCSQGTSVMLARPRVPPESGPSRAQPGTTAPDEPHPWHVADAWALGAGEGRRYARASGDYNPVHLWGVTARAFGFRQPILHGFCTAARVAHHLVQGPFGGDPGALRRLQVSFRSPIALPARVRLLTRHDGAAHRFRVTDDGGSVVYAEGSSNGTEQPPV